MDETRPSTSYGPARIYVIRRLPHVPGAYSAASIYAYQWKPTDVWQIHDVDARIYGAFTEAEARAELQRVATERFAHKEEEQP